LDRLPNFPYRDDGMLLWSAISNFVGKCSNSGNDRHRTEAFPG